MQAREAAEFLGISYSSFLELAAELPHAKISATRHVYLRSELVAWLKDGGLRPDNNGLRSPTMRRGARRRFEPCRARPLNSSICKSFAEAPLSA